MLTFSGNQHRMCDGVSRRDFLKAGALGLGGLTLADLFRLRSLGAVESKKSHRGVIMVYLPGGPSHIDMYDMKPNAPVEIRGEFKPIPTNVAGTNICELMPMQAQIADKYSIVNGIQSIDTHSAELLMRGHMGGPGRRPVFGSIVSKLRGGGNDEGMPAYVALGGENGSDPGDPSYLGTAHKPFSAGGPGMANLSLVKGVTPEQLGERKALLSSFDTIRRDLDTRGDLHGMDAFTARALEMVTSPKVREAFDVNREPKEIQEKYGTGKRLLQALRLVQAGVSVVTVSVAGTVVPVGDWDSHGTNDGRKFGIFQDYRQRLPVYDKIIHAFISDLYEKGLDKDIAVVIWGEFGRTPKINKDGGRDHWAPAGWAQIVGGGFQMGQVIGDTGPKGERERARSTPYTPANVLATLYRFLGIDPETTLPDLTGRPMYLLDDRESISELG
ncbi:MAG: DUF1501 domain-containing protein [Planctomycetia bacterium]|nr:DUF1501 domain-containing protein [Planctomycetia bacterium]